MLEEDFTGDERHETVPTSWLRHGFLNKRMRTSTLLTLFNYSSWKVRNFNLTERAVLEHWLSDIGSGGLQKGSCNMIGAKVEHLDPHVHRQCDGKAHCFRITPVGDQDQRQLVLMASSKAEADAWVISLEMAAGASSGDFLRPPGNGDGSRSAKSLGSTSSQRTIDLTPDEE